MLRFFSFNYICITIGLSALFVTITANSAEIKVIPQPARIGGAVTIGDQQLTQENANNYIFVVTKRDNSLFFPPIKLNGLNEYNWYVINIPIYDAFDQPDAAHVGDNAVIHVYYNDTELSMLLPKNGQFVIGESGSRTQMDLKLKTPDNLIIQKGDINGDSVINLKDIIVILKICNDMNDSVFYVQADCDGNGMIDLSESIFVLKTIVGL